MKRKRKKQTKPKQNHPNKLIYINISPKTKKKKPITLFVLEHAAHSE